jgi:SAM-dependent methyltransferase
MAPSSLEQRLESHSWGSGEGPEFYGPRHDYREALMLRRLLPALPGRRVLNAGCGAGSLTLKLIDAGCEVASVDSSTAFVERLREILAERYPGRSPPVEVGDLLGLRFEDGAFDGVVCGEVLEHLDDDAQAAREFARVLRPGGVVVATVPANPWRYDWFDHWVGHRRRYTPEGLSGVLGEAGFADVEVASWGFPLTGLYHRKVYERLLRRRLSDGEAGPVAPPRRLVQRLLPLLRAVFELDSLFLGRRPGYFGLLATARKGP